MGSTPTRDHTWTPTRLESTCRRLKGHWNPMGLQVETRSQRGKQDPQSARCRSSRTSSFGVRQHLPHLDCAPPNSTSTPPSIHTGEAGAQARLHRVGYRLVPSRPTADRAVGVRTTRDKQKYWLSYKFWAGRRRRSRGRGGRKQRRRGTWGGA